MKKLNLKSILGLLTAFTIVFSFTSCSEDDAAAVSTSAPVIESVSLAINDSLTTTGFADNTYIIRGTGFSTTQKIYFNDTDTYFNPTLITENVIFVTVDRETPYVDAADQIKVVTQYGEGTYNFVIAPPAPLISSYTPINATAGETVTIWGSDFVNPEVFFGDVQATIITSTINMITVELPAGVDGEYLMVSTLGGDGTAPQAIGTALYDDEMLPSLWVGGWGVTNDFAFTGDVRQGFNSIKTVIAGWSGFQFGGGPALANYSALRISIKGDDETGKVKVVLNGNYDGGKVITVTKEWQDLVIPWSELGATSAASLNELVLQEFDGDGNVLYIDDLGFVLNE